MEGGSASPATSASNQNEDVCGRGRRARAKVGMIKSAQYWIDKLNLIAHPEGGYYRETYRSELAIARKPCRRVLPGRVWFRRRSISCWKEKIFPLSIVCSRMSSGIFTPAARSPWM